MNIALPSAQRTLGVWDADWQWVITAYTLALAGLLLLGGRIADYLGQKRAFLIGLVGFAAGSALGGAAVNLGMLAAGRALQGAFAAVLIPTALSLLAVTFTQPKERATAFAVYGAIASSGGAVGLLLGGGLTEYSSWRWCMYVNVAIGVLAAAAGLAYLADAKAAGRPRFDVLGVLLATGGLVLVVYACSQAVGKGWSATEVLTLLGMAAMLLSLFVLWESRTAHPLLPLRIVWDRNRGGSCLAAGCAVIGMLGMFLLLTYYFQVVLEYSPVKAGLAFLPLTLAVAASAFGIASPLLPRVPPRMLMVPGLLVTATGLLVLTRLEVGGGYLIRMLPAGRLGAELVGVVRAADQAGVDTVWVVDHLLQADPTVAPDQRDMLEAYTTLGFLAAHTERVRLGTMVTAVTFRPPALLVKAVTTLDVLTGGRAWLGIGAGYHGDEARAMGLPLPAVAERFQRLEETLQIAIRLWAGDETPFDGAYYRLRHPVDVPGPAQRPHPPILISGTGERRALRLVAQYADACNVFDIPDGGQTVKHKLAVLARRCEGAAALGIEHMVVGHSSPWTKQALATLAQAIPAVREIHPP